MWNIEKKNLMFRKKISWSHIFITFLPQSDRFVLDHIFKDFDIITTKVWHNTFFLHCDKNVMKMWWDQKFFIYILITLSWHCDSSSICWISLRMAEILSNIVCHIVIKKWWKCDKSKSVLFFWLLSFEFSLLTKLNARWKMSESWGNRCPCTWG